ncbi:MAG: DUF58 domain-containing protein [Verrucomicrobia bacterium]|nr:DUF58 domain-containing protein [Verrucomicrobiota bacterium]
MPASSAQLLDPAHLSAIANYSLMAKVAVEGFLSGLHRSLFHGFGSEFQQYRPYTPGEDPRTIDWKVYARRERLQTRLYEEETDMNCSLLVDTSASMNYKGERAVCTKFHYASMVAATLAYLASRQGDNPGLYLYSDQLHEALPPGNRTARYASIHHALARARPSGSADHRLAMDYLGHHLRGRGLVIVISDMLEAENDLPSLLARVRIRHYDVLALQILDPDEIEFPRDKAARFRDLETGRECLTSPLAVADAYDKAMSTASSKLRRGLSGSRVEYRRLSTRDSLGEALASYLHHRERT